MLDVGRQGMEGRSRGSRAMGSSSRGWGFPVMLLRWFCTVAVVVLTRPRTAAGVTVDVEMGKEECFIVTAKKGELINGNYEVITPGRMENIKVTLKRGEGGNGNVLYQAKGKVEDFFSKEALDAGDYNLCFHNSEDDDMISNGSTSQGNKLVGLQLRLANAKTGTQIKEEEMEGPILDKEGEDDGNGGSMYSMIYGNQEGKRTIGFDLRLGLDAESMGGLTEEENERIKFVMEEAEMLLESLRRYGNHHSNMREREEQHQGTMKNTNSILLMWTLLEAMVLLGVSWSQISYIREFFETKRAL